MFQYIKGTIDSFGEDYIVIENHDIGYKIYTSLETIGAVKGRQGKIIIFTQMVVREDDISVYGFSTREELKMFQLLTTVTGVGAKVALGILSSISIGNLAGMIISEDITGLTKAQGVGKKTAQRIVLELKDKIDHKLAILEPSLIPLKPTFTDANDEVVNALMALGYNRGEALAAVHEVEYGSNGVEDMIRRALKVLAK
ncbi:Holliday junction DNA helicase RuvA [Anaerosolibacter carboniphilus]|uniref:Holliday junction branch migration complex subunit RuvA n=1 Tax=Anaerosolibacter carboniphilus TaxID=1417629 RepID=A0A841KNJ9_9FIRM|nr:Holliday junction DNA helicase RuvA [Anaerosolibacter carboniphilus]